MRSDRVYRVSGEEVDKLVDILGALEELRRVLADPTVVAAPRTALEHRGSWFGVMPAAGQGFYAVKLVGVYPDNPSRGLPLVRGLLVLIDAETGSVLLEAPAEQPTGWRTALASALAAELLGYRGGGILGVIGAGVQAHYHLLVFRSLFHPRHILITSRTPRRAEELAVRHDAVVVDRRELLTTADVVVAATTSKRPVVEGDLLKEGAIVVSVGAPRPVRELDDQVLERAGCVLVDTRKGVYTESDDVPGWVEAVELSEALRGEKKCEWSEVGVYKSVGTPVFDLAIAVHLYSQARRRGEEGSL